MQYASSFMYEVHSVNRVQRSLQNSRVFLLPKFNTDAVSFPCHDRGIKLWNSLTMENRRVKT